MSPRRMIGLSRPETPRAHCLRALILTRDLKTLHMSLVIFLGYTIVTSSFHLKIQLMDDSLKITKKCHMTVVAKTGTFGQK